MKFDQETVTLSVVSLPSYVAMSVFSMTAHGMLFLPCVALSSLFLLRPKTWHSVDLLQNFHFVLHTIMRQNRSRPL